MRPPARALPLLLLAAILGGGGARSERCAESYPEVCIAPLPTALGCEDIAHRDFLVTGPDSHGLDPDRDGIGCDTSGPMPEWMAAYPTQMHLHGHSNHNAGGSMESKVASMQWHAAEAALTGAAEVLWWSDHAHVFDQHPTFEFDLQKAALEPDSLDVVNLGRANANGHVARLAAEIGGGTPTVTIRPATAAFGSWAIPPAPASVRTVDLKACVTLDDWTPGFRERREVLGQNPAGLALFVHSDGRLEGRAPAGATGAVVTAVSSEPVALAGGGRLWLRFTFDRATGLGSFFTSTDAAGDHARVSWSRLGDPVASSSLADADAARGYEIEPVPMAGVLHGAALVLDGAAYAVDLTTTAGLTSTPPDYSEWGPWSVNGSGWAYAESSPAGPGGVAFRPHEVEISLAAEPAAAEWQWLSYEARSGAPVPTIHNVLFARPLSSGAVAELDLDCASPGPDAVCEIELRLAWHSERGPVHHTVVYRIDSEARSRRSSLLEPGRLLVVVPPRAGGRYRFELLEDARALPNGDDNTPNRLFFRVGSRRGAVASMTLRGFRLWSRRPERLNQLVMVQHFAGRYQGELGVTQHVGVESGSRILHMNAFLPAPMGERELELLSNFKSAGHILEWAAVVHERGGLVSYNHPFHEFRGLRVCGEDPAAVCVPDLAERMLANSAWAADLLEVGYLNRGLELARHLQLWDILTSNGLILGGTGVSDSHGNHWAADPHPFVTWLIAASPEAPHLIDAMRARRMYFGNPFEWRGVFTLRVGGGYMGERIPNPGATSELRFTLDPWPEDVEVHLVQGLLGAGRRVEYLHRGTLVPRGSDRVAIDASRPSFVRLEAYRRGPGPGEPTPLVFTNPVVMAAPRGAPGERREPITP